LKPASSASLWPGYLQVTVATLLFGAVALFAKLIPLPATSIAWGRAAFAVAALAPLMLAARRNWSLPRGSKGWLITLAMGLCMSGNWYFFFKAVQISNVAIAVVSLFCYPFITALLEPLFFRQRHQRSDTIATLIAFSGIALAQWSASHDPAGAPLSPTLGIVYGILSGLCMALRNLLSRGQVATSSSLSLTAFQMAIAGVVFLPFSLPTIGLFSEPRQLLNFILLGSVITAGSHWLFNHSLKTLTTTQASVFVSAQPILSILLAAWLLAERPAPLVWVGCGLIALAIALSSLAGQRPWVALRGYAGARASTPEPKSTPENPTTSAGRRR